MQELYSEDDHAEMVQNWLDECAEKGLDPNTGRPLDGSEGIWEDRLAMFRAEY